MHQSMKSNTREGSNTRVQPLLGAPNLGAATTFPSMKSNTREVNPRMDSGSFVRFGKFLISRT